MGGKFSHKLEVFLPSMLLNRSFLKENRYYPHAGWENLCAKIFPKRLLGQCIGTIDTIRTTRTIRTTGTIQTLVTNICGICRYLSIRKSFKYRLSDIARKVNPKSEIILD
jgi:hypothetical protein